MKCVLQRVAEARVEVAGETVGAIGPGLLALVAVLRDDDAGCVEALAAKLAHYRVFPDERGRMHRSLLDGAQTGPLEVLVVSQFTLAADGRRGRRPSFDAAAPPERAEPLIEHLVSELRALGMGVATGRFGAAMEVHLVNKGPATFLLET